MARDHRGKKIMFIEDGLPPWLIPIIVGHFITEYLIDLRIFAIPIP
jgi:hypothetical protein